MDNADYRNDAEYKRLGTVRKFITGCFEGGVIGHTFPEIAKKYAGHIFMQLPTATSVGVGIGISVGIRIIDGALGYSKWMENHQFVKGLSSFAITQITGAVAAMALTAGSTGIITVAAMVAAIWLLVKVTDFALNKFTEYLTEKSIFRAYEKLVKELDPDIIFTTLGINRIACYQEKNEYKFYLGKEEVQIDEECIALAGVSAKLMLDEIPNLKIDGIDLMDVKYNRFIKPLQDKVNKYKLPLEVFANFAAEDKKDVSGLFSDLSKNKVLDNEVQILSAESKMKLSKEGLQTIKSY